MQRVQRVQREQRERLRVGDCPTMPDYSRLGLPTDPDMASSWSRRIKLAEKAERAERAEGRRFFFVVFLEEEGKSREPTNQSVGGGGGRTRASLIVATHYFVYGCREGPRCGRATAEGRRFF